MTFLGKVCDINDTIKKELKLKSVRACLQGKNFIIHKFATQRK